MFCNTLRAEVSIDPVEKRYRAVVVFALLIIFWWLVNKAERRKRTEGDLLSEISEGHILLLCIAIFSYPKTQVG